MELQDILYRIDELKAEIDSLRPIDAETEQRIMQKFRLNWNFHSNNLEGNSLTYGETKSFLLHGITAEGKPLKDHLDLKGHNDALLLLDDVIKDHRPLTETFIREVHEIILHEPYDRPAITPDGKPTTKRIQVGKYKETPNHVKTVTGEIFYFATPEETPAKMNDLIDWYEREITGDQGRSVLKPPFAIAAEFHYKFIRIHPFDDGNGRMARILMNLILMKNGYPPVVIKTQEREDYFRALKVADGGDIAYFTKYIGEQLIKSMELYLRGAKGESIEEKDDLDKEFSILNAELKSENVLSQHATPRNITEAIYEHVFPLCMIIEQKSRPVKEHFLDFERTMNYKIVDSNHLNTLGSQESSWEDIRKWLFGFILSKEKKIRMFQSSYELKGFKKTVEAHNLQIEVKASFNDYNYTIRGKHAATEKIKTLPYGKKINNEELSEFITPVLKELIRSIRQLKSSA